MRLLHAKVHALLSPLKKYPQEESEEKNRFWMVTVYDSTKEVRVKMEKTASVFGVLCWQQVWIRPVDNFSMVTLRNNPSGIGLYSGVRAREGKCKNLAPDHLSAPGCGRKRQRLGVAMKKDVPKGTGAG
jgi:hypothetical protein